MRRSLQAPRQPVNVPPASLSSLRAQLCAWFDSPLGRSVQAVEAHHLRTILPTLYGTVALQLGCIGRLDLLDASVVPTRILLDVNGAPHKRPTDSRVEAALTGARTSRVVAYPDTIPFEGRSVDVALLPHTLDFSRDPHQVLREVSRILVPEGHVVILGFNGFSLWGLRRLLARPPRPAPWCGQFFGLARIRDWLELLDFECTHGTMLYYRPPIQRDTLRDRFYFLEKAGDRWWPLTAAVYLLVAKKRVPGMTPLPLQWKAPKVVRPAAEPAWRTLSRRRLPRRARRYG